MSIRDSQDWGDVERRAVEFEGKRIHEQVLARIAEVSSLPLVKITCEDRLRGAILEAMDQIQAGHSQFAWETLKESLKL